MADIIERIILNHSDLVWSCIAGLVIALVVVQVPNPSTTSLNKSEEVSGQTGVHQEEDEKQVEEMAEAISKTLEHKPHLRKFFGLEKQADGVSNSVESKHDNMKETENINDRTEDTVDNSDNIWVRTPDPDREKIRELVKKAQQSEMEDDEAGAILLRTAFGVCMLIAFVLSANVITKGEVGRFLAGMFPVEAAALGLKDCVQKV